MQKPQCREDASDPERELEAAKSTARKLLFISHANPEDNAAASWFATQLTLLGYEVWCDLKNTHGGESDFWLKVQKKIENDAAKFIFILSNASRDFEKKKGIYKEVQAADNMRRDNFILPLRIQKLTGSVPILISPDLYIPSENWADGLRELHKRLIEDGVPGARQPDFTKISSWWSALSVQDAVVRQEASELVSNIFCFQSLPDLVHFLRISADGNLLAGPERLRGVLPKSPAYSSHGDYAISFACAHDFLEVTSGYEIEDDFTVPTAEFLRTGNEKIGIDQQTARNIATYLLARSVEEFLFYKGLCYKQLRYSSRRIWFPAYGLIDKNKHSISEPGRRKAPASFVGTLSHYGKRYIWHFGVQPVIDLHTHSGMLISPKAILTEPYRSDRGDKPIPIDNKKALKKLSWWNKEWRTKLLAFAAWLAGNQETIRIPSGYQQIVLSAKPEVFSAPISYLEKNDDTLLKEIMEWSSV